MCATPFIVKKDGKEIPVPCGKCPICKKRRVSGWSFRLMQQDKISISSMFITLTYDNKNVPITPKGFMSLYKQDLQLFFKRLRWAHSRSSGSGIKYYACGEYGGQTLRPHYHVILFNSRIELIQDAWRLGHIHYGTLTPASVGYTLKYMCKVGKIPMHKNDDRLKEFALMSKGLGANYLSDAIVQYHKADLVNRMHLTIEDGKKVSMPRYYKDKLYDSIERELIAEANLVRQNEKDSKYYSDMFKQFPGTWLQVHKARVNAAFEKMHKDSLTRKN